MLCISSLTCSSNIHCFSFFHRKFICKLPDKGKKILDYVAKLKAAIAEHEKVRGKCKLFDPASLKSELRQKAPDTDGNTNQAWNSDQILDGSSLVLDHPSKESSGASKTPTQLGSFVQPGSRGDEEVTEIENPVSKPPTSSGRATVPPSSEAIEHLPQQCVSSETEDNCSSSYDLLVDRLQRIKVSDEHSSEETTSTSKNLTGLGSRTQKKPHFMEVLEMRAQNPVPSPHKFKTNV